MRTGTVMGYIEGNHPLEEEIDRRISTIKNIDPSHLQDLYTVQNKKLLNSLSHFMLVTHRNYIISIKKPLLNSIVSLSNGTGKWWHRLKMIIGVLHLIKKYPTPTYENIRYRNTKVWLDIERYVFQYLHDSLREELTHSMFQLTGAEFEHDGFYAGLRDVVFEQMVRAMLTGEWACMPELYKEKWWVRNWSQPEPYGGEHSLIYRIQERRERIIELIGGL